MKIGSSQTEFENEENSQLVRILTMFIWITWGVYFAVLATALVFKNWKLTAATLIGNALLLIPLELLRRDRLRFSSVLVVLFSIVTVTVIATIGQGVRDLALVAFPLILIFAGRVLNRKFFLLSVSLALAAVCWLALGEIYGGFIPKPFEGGISTWIFLIVLTLILLVAIAVDMLAINMRNLLGQARWEVMQREHATKELAHSERKYRMLHETMRDGFCSVTMDGRILESNRTYRTMLGYSETELSQLTYMDITPEKWHAIEEDIVENQVLKHGYSTIYQKEYRKKEGTLVPAELQTILLYSEDGNPSGMWAVVRDITERKQAEEHLKRNEAMLKEMGNTAKVGAWKINLSSMEETWTEEIYLTLEVDGSYRPIVGKGIEFFASASRPVMEKAFYRAIEHDEPFDLELEFISAKGTHKWVHVIGRRDIENNDIHGTFQDITERVQAQAALRDSEYFVKGILDSLTSQIAVLDENGVIVAVNEAWRKFARENDSPESTDYLGINYLSVCQSAMRQGDTVADQVDLGIRAVLNGTRSQFTTEYPCASPAQQLWFSITVVPQHRPRQGVIVIHQDITERKQAEQALQSLNVALQTSLVREKELARTDQLTGIKNRRHLFELAEHEFEVAARYQKPLSVLMFDVDHFKKVNDVFGHAVGDQMLQQVTKITSNCLRTADVIGRYGGEEFVILMPMTNAEKAYVLAERIREDVSALSMATPNGIVRISLSIGIVEVRPSESVEDAFRRVDNAMYSAKQNGRNRTEFGDSQQGLIPAHQLSGPPKGQT
jgi:diguanylate cyclase (GGDEF)-like protein/PAS domain S-box-containing protein